MFGTDWPYADLPPRATRPPTSTASATQARTAIDAANAAALVPRLAAGLGVGARLTQPGIRRLVSLPGATVAIVVRRRARSWSGSSAAKMKAAVWA